MATLKCTTREVGTNAFFGITKILMQKCSEMFPNLFRLLYCGSEKSRRIPPNFPFCRISKNHRRASAGAQGERFSFLKVLISHKN